MTVSRPLLFAATLLFAVVGSGLEPVPARAEPVDGSAAREVALKTADGMQISATFHPAATPGGPGAVLLPMFKSDRLAWDSVLEPLQTRGVSVLAIDPRGHGRSAMQGKVDVGALVASRDPKPFAAMHEDAIAAVRWLAKEGRCDPKRIALVGASVGGAVAVDAASRHPTEVAAILWLSPGVKYLGLDTLAQLKSVPATLPLMLIAHAGEAEGARSIVAVRPAARVVVFDDPPPPEAGAERAWAHGTRMLNRIPLMERTVASFVTAATGSTTEDVVLDGIVTTTGPNADPWDRAVELSEPVGGGTAHVIRVGRRLLFGGVGGPDLKGLTFEVQTGPKGEKAGGFTMVGPPQVVGVDLKKSSVAWSWGGMGSMPSFPGLDPKTIFGKTYPAVRSVATEAGVSFEGEWFIPMFGDSSNLIRLYIGLETEVPPRPQVGGVESHSQFAVDVPSR